MSENLSPRERECVRLAGQGLEDKEIAARLGISPRTVGNHLHRAYGKLGVSDRKLAARRLSNGYSGIRYSFPKRRKTAQLARRRPNSPAMRKPPGMPVGSFPLRPVGSSRGWGSSSRVPPSPFCSPSGL